MKLYANHERNILKKNHELNIYIYNVFIISILMTELYHKES